MNKLNNAQDAIKQAFPDQLIMFGGSLYNIEAYMCLPKFWQTLGKARGWGSYYDDEGMPRLFGLNGYYPDTTDSSSGFDGKEWLYHAMGWFETRMSNGDETAFWQSLP